MYTVGVIHKRKERKAWAGACEETFDADIQFVHVRSMTSYEPVPFPAMRIVLARFIGRYLSLPAEGLVSIAFLNSGSRVFKCPSESLLPQESQ